MRPDNQTFEWIRDRALGLILVTAFLVSWVGQLVFEWAQYVDEQRTHGEGAAFWSADFWESFFQSTFENWQSEFLQLASFVILAAYFIYKGSAESRESDERTEALLEAVAEKVGVDTDEVEQSLEPKYRKR